MRADRYALGLGLGLIMFPHQAQADLEGLIPSGEGSDWAPFYYNTDGASFDDLGDAVALRDDWFMIGEPSGDGAGTNTGTAWILSWNEDSDAFNVPVDLGALVPTTDIVADAQFGFSVDVDGAYAVVGAPTCSLEGTWSGRAYLFEYDGENWSHSYTFTDGAAWSEFGYSVDISGTAVAIGEPGDSADVGYVHLYEINPGLDGSVVRPVGGLPPGRFGGRWGEAVDRDGDLLVIGAPADVGFVGVYEQMSSDTYDFTGSITPPTDLQDDQSRFGASVTIDGTTIIVGAPWPEAGTSEHGAAVVYEQNTDDTWSLTARLDDDATASNSRFGQSVSLHDGLAIVGIPADDPAGPSSGSAKLFRYAPTSDLWTMEHHLIGLDVSAGDGYGHAVAAGPHGVAVGVPRFDTFSADNAGAAYIYRQMPWDDGNWQHDSRYIRPCLASAQTIDNPVETGPYASFGRDVAHDETTAIVGDPYAVDDTGTPSGDVAFFEYVASSAQWTPMVNKDIVLPSDIQQWEYFGGAVDIDGDFAIIGGYGHDSNRGRAVIMRKSGSTWSPVDELLGDSATSTRFGYDVAVETAFGMTCFIVGAPDVHHKTGRVHLYVWDEADQEAVEALTITDLEWSSGALSRFGESVDLDVTGSDTVRLAIGNPWQEASSGYGSVSLFEAIDGSGIWIYGNYTNLVPYADFPAAQGNYCAENIDLDGAWLIVGMPYTSGSGYQSGAAAVYQGTDPDGSGAYQWSVATLLGSPDSDDGDFAGYDVAIDESSQRAVLGIPGMDYAGVNAGAAMQFSKGLYGWEYEATLISRAPLDGVAVGTSVALDGSSLLAGAPSFDVTETPPNPRQVLSWDLVERTAFRDPDAGSMGADNSWSAGVGGEGYGLFSLWLADPYSVLFDIDTWVGSLQVELDQIELLLYGSTRTVTGSVTVAGVTDLKSAALTVSEGTLVVQDDLVVGQPGGYGQLNLTSLGTLEVVDTLNLTQDAGTTLTIRSAAESKITTMMQPPTINGSMRVDLSLTLDPEDITEGTTYVLVSSGMPPTSVGLDALVLPGLPNGLAFEVSYGAPPNRSADAGCGPSLIADCFGNCCPETWLGDDTCDNGAYSYGGVEIFLNCESLDCDGGDCKECWDDDGAWEMSIEVVTLAGLLDFDDPSSVLVEGEPTALEVVDLTNDGAEEICVTFAGSPGQLHIFENDGAGGVAQQIILSTGDEPVDITSGDFDDDGRMDLAVANNLGQSVDIYYNDDNDVSNGFDVLSPPLDVGAPPTCLAGIKMDSDTVDDLVVGLEDTDSDGNGYWAIYLGSAALRGGGMGPGGGIEPSGTPLGVDPSEEEDQKDFIFVGRTDDGKTNVGKSTDLTTGFALEIDEYVTGADPGGISLGDFDSDGMTDIAVTSTTNGTVAILRQDEVNPGLFLAATQLPVGDDPTRITAVDFDGDGNLDLAAIVHEPLLSGGPVPFVRVLQNDGSLTFTSVEVAEGENVTLVDTGDVSGDGTAQLVTVGSGASFRGADAKPMLSLRQVESTCAGDATGDGNVDVEDLLDVLSEFGSCTSSCNGDFNGDGAVDITDLLTVIDAWGPCPRK